MTGTAWSARLPMPSAYFELALRVFGDTAEAVAGLCAGTGVNPAEPGPEITLGQQLQQVRNINRCQPAGWGLRLGSRFEAATHGALGFAAVSAPTVADTLAVISRYGHVRSPYYRFATRRDAGRITLAVHEQIPLAAEDRVPLIECLMLSLQRLVETVLGGPIDAAAFHFAWSPPSHAPLYRDYFHGSIHFDAAPTRFDLPLPLLRVKSPVADAGMYQSALRRLEMLQRRLDGDDHLAAQVEQLISDPGGAAPSLAQVAARLHISTRTLMRRLTRAGTSYHALVDARRRELAQALLGDPGVHIGEVSHTLGYGDSANFGRACRRWFGMGPTRYRSRLLDLEP